jgi:hypothetical protein
MPESGFVDVSGDVGGFHAKQGDIVIGRAAVADLNGNGYEDIIAWECGRKNLRLFVNEEGRRFTDNTEESGLGQETWGVLHMCNTFDFRCLGRFDLYVGHPQHGPCRSRLFLNDGTGHFTPSGILFPRGSKGVTFCDVNDSGFPDLFDSGDDGALYINHGGQALVDETRQRFGGKRPLGYQGTAFADFNNDGYPDMFTTGHHYVGASCHMYVNDGSGHFTEVTEEYALDFHEECEGADGAVFADLNNNGSLDLIVVKNGMVWVHESVDNGKRFERRAVIDAKDFDVDPHSWAGEAAAVADFDNDGLLDFYVAGTKHVYRNEGDFKFTKAWEVPIVSGEQNRQVCFGDLDNDGNVDILYCSWGGPLQLLRNDLPNSGNWLQVFLIGPSGDAGGFGVRVSVFDKGHAGEMAHFRGMRESNSGYMYHVSPTRVLHFGGLDPQEEYDLVVRLPFDRCFNFELEGVRPGQRVTVDCRPEERCIVPTRDVGAQRGVRKDDTRFHSS